MQVKVGCCGFAGSQGEYFRLFRLVEIQNTFYQLPRLLTAEKWRTAAPAGFEFTMKARQLITHEPTSPTYRRLRRPIGPRELERYGRFRSTEEVFQAWEQTAAFARTLGATLVVFQSPASFRPTEDNIANLRAFFRRIGRAEFRLAWEPRGEWPPEVVRRFGQEFALIHCVDPFKGASLCGDIQYFRLHGNSGYSQQYTDADLHELKGWAQQKPSYVLFNNKSMREDAQRFLKLVPRA